MPLEGLLGRLGAILGSSGCVLGRLGAVLERLGSALGRVCRPTISFLDLGYSNNQWTNKYIYRQMNKCTFWFKTLRFKTLRFKATYVLMWLVPCYNPIQRFTSFQSDGHYYFNFKTVCVCISSCECVCVCVTVRPEHLSAWTSSDSNRFKTFRFKAIYVLSNPIQRFRNFNRI